MSDALRANAAILYKRDAFETARDHLMGRQAAGEGFVAAFARHAQVDRLYCHSEEEQDYRHFVRKVAPLLEPGQTTDWIPSSSMARLAEPGCLFLPGPGLQVSAWKRRFLDQRAYSLCGITHTIASDRVMDAVGALASAPVQAWDVVICTSRAVRQTLQAMIDGWWDYLEERTGVRPPLPIELPVIPLGVDCDRLARPEIAAARDGLRQRFGIGPDDFAVLFRGRLSFHSKANPVPMYLALEDAARRTGRKVHLLQYGRFYNSGIEAAIRAGAANLCPSVNAIFVDGKAADLADTIWSAADVFASLSDNIQESFGLAPIEAMAAGLPCVVTDWDGYRDTVRHGIEGFAVPTTMPPPGAGGAIGERYALELDNYDIYIGQVSQFTAVDVEAAAAAFVGLIENPELRRGMADAARRRAREAFDWRVVIARYQELWAELARRRGAADELVPPVPGRDRNPLRPDPFAAFRSYPSSRLTPEARVAVRPTSQGPGLKKLLADPLTRLGRPFAASDEACAALVDRLARVPAMTVAELIGQTPDEEARSLQLRTICWLAKAGILWIVEAPKASGGDDAGA